MDQDSPEFFAGPHSVIIQYIKPLNSMMNNGRTAKQVKSSESNDQVIPR